MEINGINIKQVRAIDIYDIRQRLLRPSQPIESVHFDGDELPNTIHIGIFCGSKLIGCASMMRSQNANFDQSYQYQMRGVAVEEEYQGNGMGKALVKYAEFVALNRSCNFIWLNARCHIVEFYRKQGYKTFGEPFMIPNVCEHIVMYKDKFNGGCESCNAKNKEL